MRRRVSQFLPDLKKLLGRTRNQRSTLLKLSLGRHKSMVGGAAMRDKIDPLITERAPWLYSGKPGTRHMRHLLELILGYRKTLELGEALEPKTASDIMNEMSALIAQDITCEGLDNIPATGPALMVANHPTGIADGIMVWHMIAQVRPDAFFFANADILRVLPQMTDVIAPVEWRKDQRDRTKTRETLQYTRTAIESGRIGVIFPSGRLAKRQGLRLHERPWMASAVTLARKFDVPIIPLHIQARNSVLFYLFDLIHPTLRDITLFHETLNKGRQPYKLKAGPALRAKHLSDEVPHALERLRHATLTLGEPDVSLIHASRQTRSFRKLLPQA